MPLCIDCRSEAEVDGIPVLGIDNKIFRTPDVELDEPCSRCGRTNSDVIEDAYPELASTLD